MMYAVNSQNLSTALTVISSNMESLTASKASILSEMYKRERCHCLCLKETHRPTNLSRPKISGMLLVAERPHNKYGSAIHIREGLKVGNVYERVQGNVELVTIVMFGVVVHSVYKPPNDQFVLPALGHTDLPHLVIGDFNSHSTTWGYDTTSLHLEASRTCVRSQSWNLSRTPNTARSVIVTTQSWYRKLYLSDDVLTL